MLTSSHSFEERSFRQPVFCAHCSELLWGIYKQGCQCTNCGVTVHRRCYPRLTSVCSKATIEQAAATNVPHTYRVHYFLIPASCDHCGSLLIGRAMKCSQQNCAIKVHMDCANKHSPLCGLQRFNSTQIQGLLNMAYLRSRVTSIPENNLVRPRSVESAPSVKSSEAINVKKSNSKNNRNSLPPTFSPPHIDNFDNKPDIVVNSDQPADEFLVNTDTFGPSRSPRPYHGCDHNQQDIKKMTTPMPPRIVSPGPPKPPRRTKNHGSLRRTITVSGGGRECPNSSRKPLIDRASTSTSISEAPAKPTRTRPPALGPIHSFPGATKANPVRAASPLSSEQAEQSDFSSVSVLVVGRGAFAQVALAKHGQTDTKSAHKHMAQNDLPAPSNKSDLNLLHDLSKLLRMEMVNGWPFLADLYAAVQNMDRPCLATGYYPSTLPLHEMPSLSDDYVRFIAGELVLALEFIHDRYIISRNLTMGNVMLNDVGHVRLFNAELSKPHMVQLERTNTMCGSSVSMAPEMVGGKSYSYPVDWWALGLLIYELLAGKPLSADELGNLPVVLKKKPITYPDSISPAARDLVNG
eukprot:Ihof_evm4s218 gene=Ihof_evmTU4s218